MELQWQSMCKKGHSASQCYTNVAIKEAISVWRRTQSCSKKDKFWNASEETDVAITLTITTQRGMLQSQCQSRTNMDVESQWQTKWEEGHTVSLGYTAQLFQRSILIMDIATYRLNQPRGQCSENHLKCIREIFLSDHINLASQIWITSPLWNQ